MNGPQGQQSLVQQPLGKWFDDFQVGMTFLSPGRTITEADISSFAGLTGDFMQIHTDEEYARRTEFRTRIAHGLLGLALTAGLMLRTNYTHGTGIASLGWDKWRFVRPIQIGDTVKVKWRIADCRRSASRPSCGIVTEWVELLNQRGEITQQGEHVVMVRRNPDLVSEGA